MNKHLQKFTCCVIICCFIGVNAVSVEAGEIFVPPMPAPGTMVNLSQSFVPAHLSGMTIHPDDALKFDFLINRGQQDLAGEQKNEEYTKLVKYFLASLTIADKDQWVNLSPYESGRIIENNFGLTEMGRDLLAQDYLLKQITSSMMYPESGLGKRFWDRVYERAFKEFGNTNIPVNTINKVWIMPDDAAVYESNNSVLIVRSHMKVMLEEDYLAVRQSNAGLSTLGLKSPQGNSQTRTLTSRIIKEVIIPELEKEVNEGKNFAQLRQIVSAMILATWYKQALKESILGKVYADRSKVKGVDQDPKANEAIYQQYLAAFKKGVYSYIKEDEDKYTNQIIPRKYFAGGFVRDQAMLRVYTSQSIPFSMANALPKDAGLAAFDSAQIALISTADAAMSDKVNDTQAKYEIGAAINSGGLLRLRNPTPQEIDAWIKKNSGLNLEAYRGLKWGAIERVNEQAPTLAANAAKWFRSSAGQVQQPQPEQKPQASIFPDTQPILTVGEAQELNVSSLAEALLLSPPGAVVEEVMPTKTVQNFPAAKIQQFANYFETVYQWANNQDIKGLYDGKRFYFGNDVTTLARQIYPNENLPSGIVKVITRMRSSPGRLVPIKLSKDKWLKISRVDPIALEGASSLDNIAIRGNNAQVDHLFEVVNNEFAARGLIVRKSMVEELNKYNGLAQDFQGQIDRLTQELAALQGQAPTTTVDITPGAAKQGIDLPEQILEKKRELRALQERQLALSRELRILKDRIKEQEVAAQRLLEEQNEALELARKERTKNIVQRGVQFIAKVLNYYMFRSIGEGIGQFSTLGIEKQTGAKQAAIATEPANVPLIETGVKFWTGVSTESVAQQKAINEAVRLIEGAINLTKSERPISIDNDVVMIDGFLKLSNQAIYFGEAQRGVDDVAFVIRKDAQGVTITLSGQSNKIVGELEQGYIDALNKALQLASVGVVKRTAVAWDGIKDAFDIQMPIGQPLFFNVSGTDFRVVEVNGRMQVARASEDRKSFVVINTYTQSLATSDGKPVKITFDSKISNGQKVLILKRAGGIVPEVTVFEGNIVVKKGIDLIKTNAGDYLLSMPVGQPLLFEISRKIYRAERSETGEIKFLVLAADGVSYEKLTSSVSEVLIGGQPVKVDVSGKIIAGAQYVSIKQLSGENGITVAQYYGAGNLDAVLKYATSIKEASKNSYGGIDLNASNFGLQIKRDGRGVALPLSQQDMNMLGRIEGFVPNIIEIKPVAHLPILSELQEKGESTPKIASAS